MQQAAVVRDTGRDRRGTARLPALFLLGLLWLGMACAATAADPPAPAAPPAPALACKRGTPADQAYQALKNAAPTLQQIRVVSRFRFLPLDSDADVIAFTPLDQAIRYRVIWRPDGNAAPRTIDTDQVWAEAATTGAGGTDFTQQEDKSPKTLIHFAPAAADPWVFWQGIRVYVVGCGSDDVPRQFGQFSTSLSSPWVCRILAVLLCAVFYVLAAFGTFYIHRAQRVYAEGGGGHGLDGTHYATRVHHFNPVVLTAGTNGRGSATKLQILFFSLVVFGLVSYVWMCTGYLSDLSSTILLLMGISGLGAIVSGATEVAKSRLDFDNWAWLMNRHWIPRGGVAEVNRAQWKDIVMTEGEFDVYRFQMIIFSVLVGMALLGAGGKMMDLSTFTIPSAFLGILGLSQAVYVAGKLVAPPSIAQLNEQIGKLRDAETALRTALARRDPASPDAGVACLPLDRKELVARVGDLYDKYIEAWETTRTMFESALSRAVSAVAEGYRPPFPYMSAPQDVLAALDARSADALAKASTTRAALAGQADRIAAIDAAGAQLEAARASAAQRVEAYTKLPSVAPAGAPHDVLDDQARARAAGEAGARDALDLLRQRLDQLLGVLA